MEGVKRTNPVTYILKDVKGGIYDHLLQRIIHKEIHFNEKLLKRKGASDVYVKRLDVFIHTLV